MSGDLVDYLTALGAEQDSALRSSFMTMTNTLGHFAHRFDPDGGVERETREAIALVPDLQKDLARAAVERGLTKCESPIEKAILPWLVTQRYQFFNYCPTVLFPGERDQYMRHSLAIIPQLPIGRFRADFALAGSIGSGPVRFVVVECDGKEFHDGVDNVKRDVNRDVAILANPRVLDVIRIDGSQIMHDAERAAQMVARGVVTAWSVDNKKNAHKFGVAR